MRATNRLNTRLGQAEVFDLAFANQVLHGPSDVFDRNVGIDAVLVEEIDPVGLEPLQRGIGHRADVGWPAVETCLLAVLELEAELRRNHDMIANRSERFADELFVRERPVRFGRVEECDASVNGGANDADAIIGTGSWAVSEADAHAPESESRDFQSACAQHSLLHFALLRTY